MRNKLLLLGGNGMLGSAFLRLARKHFDILSPGRNILNLFDKKKVINYFKKEKPYYVIDCAAKAGGIYANSVYPADFIYENLLLQNNIISACHEFKVKKLVFLGSSCIYPRECKQPIKEKYLLTSPLEKTNEFYAIAKIAGLKMIEAFNKQYNHNFISIMPTNIYGINDNFHPMNSHVVPALIQKIHDGLIRNKKVVKLWGSGKVLRDFLYVDDVAEAIIFLTKFYNNQTEPVNVGSGKEISIKLLSKLISKILGYSGKIVFDRSYPDGTPRKILDTSKIKYMGWKPKYSLETGLKKTIKWYLQNIKKVTKK
jgi:GDP-L-fucose synthase